MSLLHIDSITRRFGAFTALDGVSLRVEPGTVTALLGENGAGKSTLMKVCYGLLQPDEGALRWNGVETVIRDPAAARRLGIGMVQQHFTLVPAMTVAENFALAAPAGRLVSPRRMEAAANELMGRTGLRVPAGARVGDLPVGMQQRVEILRALSTPTRLLVLDEPTAVLSPAETEELFTVLRGLRDSATSVVLITHKLPEAMAMADRVAVLRRGELVLDAPRADVTMDSLANAMVGHSMAPPSRPGAVSPGPVVLSTPLLARAFSGEGVVRAGETLGVAGVEGNGQTELAETVVGLRDGPVRLGSGAELEDVSSWPVARRLEWGLAHIPEDRHATALALAAPLRDNFFLAGDMLPRRGPWVDWRTAGRESAALMKEYDVRAPSVETPAVDLSGGNQQKAVVAREMSREPKLLVAMHPTRGLDVAATRFVHDAVLAHRRRGGATLLVSNELDELLALSDRIVVLYGGRVTGELTPSDPVADREALGRMMTGAAG